MAPGVSAWSLEREGNRNKVAGSAAPVLGPRGRRAVTLGKLGCVGTLRAFFAIKMIPKLFLMNRGKAADTAETHTGIFPALTFEARVLKCITGDSHVPASASTDEVCLWQERSRHAPEGHARRWPGWGGGLSFVRLPQGPRGTGRHEHPPLQMKKPRLGEMPGLVSVCLSPSLPLSPRLPSSLLAVLTVPGVSITIWVPAIQVRQVSRRDGAPRAPRWGGGLSSRAPATQPRPCAPGLCVLLGPHGRERIPHGGICLPCLCCPSPG